MAGVMVGDQVTLDDEEDCIIPTGTYTVSKVNENGSFHVGRCSPPAPIWLARNRRTISSWGSNTAVWPRRILSILTKQR